MERCLIRRIDVDGVCSLRVSTSQRRLHIVRVLHILRWHCYWCCASHCRSFRHRNGTDIIGRDRRWESTATLLALVSHRNTSDLRSLTDRTSIPIRSDPARPGLCRAKLESLARHRLDTADPHGVALLVG